MSVQFLTPAKGVTKFAGGQSGEVRIDEPDIMVVEFAGDPAVLPVGNDVNPYRFLKSRALTDPNVSTDTAIASSGDGYVKDLLASVSLDGGLLIGRPFRIDFEGMLSLEMSAIAYLKLRLGVTYWMGDSEKQMTDIREAELYSGDLSESDPVVLFNGSQALTKQWTQIDLGAGNEYTDFDFLAITLKEQSDRKDTATVWFSTTRIKALDAPSISGQNWYDSDKDPYLEPTTNDLAGGKVIVGKRANARYIALCHDASGSVTYDLTIEGFNRSNVPQRSITIPLSGFSRIDEFVAGTARTLDGGGSYTPVQADLSAAMNWRIRLELIAYDPAFANRVAATIKRAKLLDGHVHVSQLSSRRGPQGIPGRKGDPGIPTLVHDATLSGTPNDVNDPLRVTTPFTAAEKTKLAGVPDAFAAVARTGSYSDLTDKPNIPVDTTVFKGAYADNTAYSAGNIVTYNNDVFMALVNIPDTNTTAPVAGTTWEQLDVGSPNDIVSVSTPSPGTLRFTKRDGTTQDVSVGGAQPSDDAPKTYTGYTVDTSGVDAAGEIRKNSGEWQVYRKTGDTDLYQRLVKGTRVIIRKDSSNHEDGYIASAYDSGSARHFTLENVTTTGTISNGDTVSIETSEGLINWRDVEDSVRADGTASDEKIPTEKAVRDALEAFSPKELEAAFDAAFDQELDRTFIAALTQDTDGEARLTEPTGVSQDRELVVDFFDTGGKDRQDWLQGIGPGDWIYVTRGAENTLLFKVEAASDDVTNRARKFLYTNANAVQTGSWPSDSSLTGAAKFYFAARDLTDHLLDDMSNLGVIADAAKVKLRTALPTGTAKTDANLDAADKLLLYEFDEVSIADFVTWHDDHHTGLSKLSGYTYKTTPIASNSAAGSVGFVSGLAAIKPLNNNDKARIKARIINGKTIRFYANASRWMELLVTSTLNENQGVLSFNATKTDVGDVLTNNHSVSVEVVNNIPSRNEMTDIALKENATGAAYQYARTDGQGNAVFEMPDTEPTQDSKKMITSGGVKTAIDAKPGWRGTWTASTSYIVGDTVVNSGALYQCKTANSDSTFTASKWYSLGGGGPTHILSNTSLDNRATYGDISSDTYSDGDVLVITVAQQLASADWITESVYLRYGYIYADTALYVGDDNNDDRFLIKESSSKLQYKTFGISHNSIVISIIKL